ncbi:MAG: hypothetical protein ABI665_12105 [Vicinamibacterales bacterium]
MIRHRLSAAVRFVDAFTLRPIDVPLDVRAEALPIVVGMPSLPWRARRAPNDESYRFLVSNNTVMPVGAIAVDVTAPGDQYLNVEPLVVGLPRPLVAHPPTPARSDYLVQHRLWPTRRLPLPPSETAVVGRFISAGVSPIAGLKLTIWLDGTPMPPAPYAYSNERGEFVYRLPALKTVNGGVIAATASLQLDVRLPPAYAAPVAPTQIQTLDGVVLAVPFALALGRVTTLTIALP